jgi:hypothetical protein
VEEHRIRTAAVMVGRSLVVYGVPFSLARDPDAEKDGRPDVRILLRRWIALRRRLLPVSLRWRSAVLLPSLILLSRVVRHECGGWTIRFACTPYTCGSKGLAEEARSRERVRQEKATCPVFGMRGENGFYVVRYSVDESLSENGSIGARSGY